MLTIGRVFLFLVFACGVSPLTNAQNRWRLDYPNPCEVGSSRGMDAAWPGPAERVVYDANQDVCWLANANLPAEPEVVAELGVKGISPNGTMDYATAVKWVAALNAFDNGAGFLGHHNWQIPVAPLQEATCGDTGTHGGSFGPGCTRSAMGNLYNIGLDMMFPESVAPRFSAMIEPLYNMKLSYYWALQNNGGTSGTANGGQEVFSFANGIQGGTTINDVYYYLLPMVAGPIGVAPYCPDGFTGVLPYTKGAAKGEAVFDCRTGYTWSANANLAARENFGITGKTTIMDTHGTFTVPLINDGAMLFETATRWVEAMNDSEYLGSNAWVIPATSKDLQDLFEDLRMASGDPRMMWRGKTRPFKNLQPFFYWGCQRNSPGDSRSGCTGYAPKDGDKLLQWSFNFDTGFQSTSSIVQKYFVMVYYPAPGRPVYEVP